MVVTALPFPGEMDGPFLVFARRGGLKLGERDRIERVTPLALLPGLTVIASDGWMDRLRAWADARG